MDGSMGGGAVPGAQDVSARQAWTLVALLCLLFIFSMVDRLILGLLVDPMSRDLGLRDSDIGLLIGTSFAVVYTLAGVPIAHFLDRGNRKRILIAGVVLWSAGTILSAFAPGMGALALCRAGVALGEAVLTPAAVSMIADVFPRERRTLPTTIYAAMAALMGAGGLIIGAAILQLAELIAHHFVLAPWRLALILAGAPPLLLAVIFASCVSEPVRGRFDDPGSAHAEQARLSVFLAHLAERRGFYLNFYAGTALLLIFLYGLMTWTPTLLIRGHGWTAAEAGYVFGLVGLGAGLVSAIVWPRFALGMGRRGVRDPLVLTLALACAAGIPFMIVAPSVARSGLLLAGLGICVFTASSIATMTPLIMQHYGPPRMRARLTSLATFAQSLIGYGVGPAAIAWLSQNWPGDGRAFGFALSGAAILAVPAASLCFFLARRALAHASTQ